MLEILDVDKRFVGLSKYVLKIRFYWSFEIPTACAGHGYIFFNPDFWDRIPHETRKTVIAHEIFHLIYKHLDRAVGLDEECFQEAADHVINIGLEDDGFTFDGTRPHKDRQYSGMAMETIYNKLYEAKKNGKNKGQGGGSGNPGSDVPEMDPAQSQVCKSDIEDLVQEALKGSGKSLDQQADEDGEAVDNAMQKGCGSGDAGANRILHAHRKIIKAQKATYNEIFEDYLIDPLSGGKRTFMRISRRQMKGTSLRMPGRTQRRGRANRLTHLVYALDVSGSITHHQADQFLQSARTIKELLNPKLMTIMLWDTAIRFEKVYREDEKLNDINVRAGGGTRLGPVYSRLKQLKPEAAVIFTDLDVGVPPKPECEIIWFVPHGTGSQYIQRAQYGDVYFIPEN